MDNQNVWDSIASTTRRVAGTLAGAASDLYGKGKKQVSILQLKNAVSTAYETLGEMVYTESAEGTDRSADRAALIEKIKRLKEQLADMQQKQDPDAPIPATIICKSCGKVIPSDSAFCSGCGAKI